MTIEKEASDLFFVDLKALARSLRRTGGWVARLFEKRTEPVDVDPYLVAQAVIRVMERCPMKSPSGTPLVWNEYRVFLSRRDHDRLRPLEGILHNELQPLMYGQLQTRRAETVGAITVRLLVDEGGDLSPGSARIRVSFVPAAGDPVSEEEITIRMDSDPVGPAVRHDGEPGTEPVGEDLPVGDSTGPVKLGTSDRGVEVRWPGGSAVVGEGTRVVFGRPHDQAQGSFVALNGAGTRVSRRHFWVEPHEDTVLVGRPSKANPVQVNHRIVQPGGYLAVEALPVEVSLSSGELTVDIRSWPVR